MLFNVPIIVLRAKNCYNAYSPDVDGCFATGKTMAEAVERFQRIAGPSLRKMIDDGKLVDDDCVGVTMAAVNVPDRLPEDITDGDFAAALKAWRQLLSYTQKELAKEWDVTPETISEWERGRRKIPGTVRSLLAQTR